MRRFKVEPEQIIKQWFKITDVKVAKHLREVLRLKKGEKIILFDGLGFEYTVEIELLSRGEVSGKILEVYKQQGESRPYLVLAQALPRAGKIDDIIKMNTEVGVSEFLLFDSEYSVVKQGDYKESKLERLARVADEAARQSERLHIPKIFPARHFADILEVEADLKLLLHSRETAGSINIASLKTEIFAESKILVLIGPEGGFSPKEIDLAKEKDFQIVYLNLPILRTETAGVVISSLLLS